MDFTRETCRRLVETQAAMDTIKEHLFSFIDNIEGVIWDASKKEGGVNLLFDEIAIGIAQLERQLV